MIKVYVDNTTDEFLSAVNKNINEFLKFYVTTQEDNEVDIRYEGIFPDFLFRTNNSKCNDVVKELYEFSKDRYIHTLSPLHEYALFYILDYCEDIYNDYEQDKEEGHDSLFKIIEENYEDEEEYPNENGGYTLFNFHTFEFYYQNLFQDFDFLDVDHYFNKFKMSPAFFNNNINVNLDDYMELMPFDIRDEYLRIKRLSEIKNVNEQSKKSKNEYTESLVNSLKCIIPGKNEAKRYEILMEEILSYAFSAHLTEPRVQVKTFDNREIIDMTFYNSATKGFWHDVKIKHHSNVVVVEFKNKELLGNDDIFQISARLNDDIGRFGILVARKITKLDKERIYRRLNKSNNVILLLSDEDIIQMLRMDVDATAYIKNMYRLFLEEA
ncbi:hypothetical protein HF078_17935 [Bacillus sp. RO2]|uniref:hypothetical protein n=1 Tax=Bacillus sp. RO2 TaxID=2723913 RepID=UPI00145ECD93|nr:hypothetical protein [Bacillus sp. RO2]NMH74960.1 hypothetical protein [Bacillus sp. RO2]